MTDWTSVRLSKDAKEELDQFKNYDDESYESVVRRLIERVYELEAAELSHDDVEEACASAIRDELGEVLQR